MRPSLHAAPDSPNEEPGILRSRAAASRWTAMVAGLVLAAGGLGVGALHWRQACSERVELGVSGCATEPTAANSPGALRAHLTRNPGDASALARLAFESARTGDLRWVAHAQRLAPAEPNVMAMAAQAALDRQDRAAAVALLIPLVRDHNSAGAAEALARLVAEGHAQAVLPWVGAHNPWLVAVVQATLAHKWPTQGLLPLLAAEVRAGGGEPALLRTTIAQLKTQGAWFDAHALWVSLHPRGLPLLYNGDFATPFEEGGFDWELPVATRSGVRVIRAGGSRFRHALRLDYDGLLLPRPQIRQTLVLLPGRYRLDGWYVGHRFRADQGPSWEVACVGKDAAPLARTEPLADTGGVWKPWALEFDVGVGCGPALQLSLQTDAAAAAAGAQGRLELADMRLRAAER